ncbi:hypothetical protein ABZ916_15340 [Streptomyces sp. NPDC046853]|uniref:hypothetical protein n=1 Tax=Streptomyces sp. NPDC046853 TaxID=3154920 RepID=UPI003409FB48
MDVPTLILLGAAGGLLRGALDVYTRFVSWQADRRAHRQLTASGEAQGEAPQFQVYFDPSVDIAAAVVHSVMGAGAAVLFGTTGQISGAYAALVVGLSAPMLLTQLGRIQTVNEAVTGERPPAGATEAAAQAGGPTGAEVGGGADASGTLGTPGVPSAAAPVGQPAFPLRTEPAPAPSANPTEPLPAPSADPAVPEPPARPTPSPGPPLPTAHARTPEPAGGEAPDEGTRLPDPTRPGDTTLPASPADGTGPGLDGPDAPRWRQRPAIGEEGL